VLTYVTNDYEILSNEVIMSEKVYCFLATFVTWRRKPEVVQFWSIFSEVEKRKATWIWLYFLPWKPVR